MNIFVVKSGFRIKVNSGALLSVAVQAASVSSFQVFCLPVAASSLVALVEHSDLLIVFKLRAWELEKL